MAEDDRAKKLAPKLVGTYEKRPVSTGSFMLDKQLARAAVSGMKVTFMVNLGSNYEVTGYITGMDAFYFMVIIPVKDEAGERTIDHSMAFVHKSAAVTKVLKEDLTGEPKFFQDEVKRVGGDFWRTCEARYLGHNSKQEASS